ncbi:MAG: Fic family protein [Mycoplasmatales bacterium]
MFNKNYLADFKMRFTYNSNAIEGNTLTLPETVSIIKDEYIPSGTGKKVREIFETINHASTFDYIIENNNAMIDSHFIKNIHNKLMDRLLYDKGRFKSNDNYILGADFETAPAYNIEIIMKNYFDNLNYQLDTGAELFTTLAESHITFERIHPFSDGNGRVGRLLINKILLSYDMEPIIIQNDNKLEYYQMLATQDIESLAILFEKLHFQEETRHQTFKNKKSNQIDYEK